MLSQNHRKPHLEIIPETSFVVFHGDEHTAASVALRGIVRLDAPESMSIKGVRVRLEGKRRVGWYYSGGVSAGEVSDKRIFFQDTKTLGTTGSHKIKAGVIEWPFEFTLQPSMPESVEGFPSTWVVYNLHADVERPMWNQKDLHAHTHIRLVKTLGVEEMETTRSRRNADIWANKLSYSISIPSDAVVFGTSILADVDLAPIRKGVTFGKIELRLIESVIKRIPIPVGAEFRSERVKTDELEVAKEEMSFPEESMVTFENESTENPTMEDERYSFKARLPLPKSLKKCRQDVDSHNINITHKFKLLVNIHNPEGHTSQLVCRLPVKLFISPNLPIDETNEVQPGTTDLTEEQLNNQEATVIAPPMYGRHQLDELYSDIAPSGYHTTAPSGVATPMGALSRRASDENLHIHGSSSVTPESQHGGSINSALLRSRLASLQDSSLLPLNTTNGVTHPPNFVSTHGATSPRPSPLHHQATVNLPEHSGSTRSPNGTSSPQSRRPSNDIHPDTLTQSDYDMNGLVRTPSYGTALRSSGQVTPYTEVPPSYDEATSRPASPGPVSPYGSASRGPVDLAMRPSARPISPPAASRQDSANADGSGHPTESACGGGVTPMRTGPGTGLSGSGGEGGHATFDQPLSRVNTVTRVTEADPTSTSPSSPASSSLRLLRGRG